ncbi:MAG: hypothetical protein ACRCV9_17635 [Burkholderiaceae bacterium]
MTETKRSSIIMAGAFAALIASCLGTQMTREEPVRPAEPQLGAEQRRVEKIVAEEKERAFQRGLTGLRMLKAASKDPDSFKVSSMLIMGDGTACLEYSGTNSFNARIRGVAVVDPKGVILHQEHDKNRFVSAWNKLCANSPGHAYRGETLQRAL